MGMFILNAPERERSFGALACIIAVLGSVAIFLAGLNHLRYSASSLL